MVKAERSLNPRRKGRQNRHIIKNKIIIPLIIILTVISLSLGITLSLGDDGSQNNYKVVKVLVYSGNDTSENSINQIKKCRTKLTPRTWFLVLNSFMILQR